MDITDIVYNSCQTNSFDRYHRLNEEQILPKIFNKICYIYGQIKPKKIFFLTVDGVTPRIKMNQERSKQFQSAKESLIKREPLADVVLPGTAFMAKLTAQLRYLVAKKISEDIEWHDVEVIVSGPDVPGESKHKIAEYIRLCKSQADYDPNTKHCMYGIRDDLLLVSLATHEPNFALVCEQDDTQNANERKKR